MSKAKDFLKNITEQGEEGAKDLKDVLDEFDYGLSTELDHNAQNLSTGTEAATTFELNNDQGPNWIELQLWDKNRFDAPIGSVRYICGMKANQDSFTLSTGKGIEKIKFNSKGEEIDKIPDLKDKDGYKDKINRIRTVFLGFQMNVEGILGVPNDRNSFENIGRRVGQGLIQKCSQYLK